MVKQDFTTEIKAPVEKVFAFVTDFRNASKWQDSVIESTQTPDGPTQLGTVNKTVRTFVGQRIEANIEVVEFVPNKKFGIKSSGGPIQFSLVQSFEQAGGGTKISSHVEMEAGGVLKLAEGAIAGGLKKEFDSQTAKLKTLLES